MDRILIIVAFYFPEKVAEDLRNWGDSCTTTLGPTTALFMLSGASVTDAMAAATAAAMLG